MYFGILTTAATRRATGAGRWLMVLPVLFVWAAVPAEQIDTNGRRLIQVLDALDVEHRWPAGVHVSWESGIPDGRPAYPNGKHTHCSAFVASAAKRLGIYILRPPEHSAELLANAQYDWLESTGVERGWHEIVGALDAQRAANRGQLVVAAYRNHHDDKPGHIAIVRPSEKDASVVALEGPQIIQAGTRNFRDTNLRAGFAGHPAAWGRSEVRYFAHTIDRWP